MADNVCSTRRSEIMRSIKGKNTKPEVLLRSLLHKMGFRFRLHDRFLPGTPDIVLRKYKTVIFVNGCFWHGHSGCKKGLILPKSRIEYWENKITLNKERDARKIIALTQMGWKVLNVFECELKKQNVSNTISNIQSFLADQLE